jgi:hypothetical protein
MLEYLGCRIIGLWTAEVLMYVECFANRLPNKISRNKVCLIKVLQSLFSSHKVRWIDVLSRGNRRHKYRRQNQLKTFRTWERACSSQHCTVVVRIWVGCGWRITGWQCWDRYRHYVIPRIFYGVCGGGGGDKENTKRRNPSDELMQRRMKRSYITVRASSVHLVNVCYAA